MTISFLEPGYADPVEGHILPGNYLPEACQGCVVVHRTHPAIFGVFPIDEDLAPFQWDPVTQVFSVVNVNRFPCFTYLSFGDVAIQDRFGQSFPSGRNRDEGGKMRTVTTFVVVADPRTAVHLARLEGGPAAAEFYAIELEQLHKPLVPPTALMPAPIGCGNATRGLDVCLCFPLPEKDGPYLCTQGVGGHLTHFFPESYHAIDLRCACHTPVLAIGDGVVREVTELHRCSGIHAANLGSWNSVTILLDCGLVVEYLHTLPGSALVRPGDEVKRGQVICESGDIGFAPEPHLHIEVHSVENPNGPSLPFQFGSGRLRFTPIAGRWYSPTGEVSAPCGPQPALPFSSSQREVGSPHLCGVSMQCGRREHQLACVASKRKLAAEVSGPI